MMTTGTLISLICMLSLTQSSVKASNRTQETKLQHRETVIEEYCTGETFKPRCSGGKNDVIVMIAARYGRMRFGRCVEEEPELAAIKDNPRFVGCSEDVKHVLDQHCSGLPECDFRIITQNFDGVKPCIAGLQMYLEASFVCVKVAAESRHCTIPLTTEPQHIVGDSKLRLIHGETTSCGSESQPWSIETLVGQRIAVSLIDLGLSRTAASTPNMSGTRGCRSLYGFIIDRNTRLNTSICGDRSSDFHDEHRLMNQSTTSMHTQIYVSRSNQLQLFMRSDIGNKFIIRVEAVGCSDLAPPSDSAWLKRVDDQLTIGCYMSRQSWHLSCVNGVWTGTVGVCTSFNGDDSDFNDADPSLPIKAVNKGSTSAIEWAMLVTVASAGVTVCCLVICVGIICLRRQRRQQHKDSTPRDRRTINGVCQVDSRSNVGLLGQADQRPC